MEELEGGRQAGELGGRGAEVGDQQQEHGPGGGAQPEALADQGGQALAGGDPQAGPDLLGDRQREGDDEQQPEQAIALLGADLGVGGDALGVVVGRGRDQAGAEHAENTTIRLPRRSRRPRRPKILPFMDK